MLLKFQAEATQKKHAAHLTERLIEAKTGQAVAYTKIADLAARWRGMGRDRQPNDGHFVKCDAHFKRFVVFMLTRNPKAPFLYQVTAEDADAFVQASRSHLAPATAQYGVRLLASAMARFLPVGATNPFQAFIGRRSANGDGAVHRKSFSAPELQSLIGCAAAEDGYMRDLITAAACTGMRRGDLCRLRWSSVDLDAGMIDVKTSKTGAGVEIPIFEPLRMVLESRQGNGCEFVFPEAEDMLRCNPDGLTWRFKKIVAKVFTETDAASEPVVSADSIEAEGVAAIELHLTEGPRRDRAPDNFRRYCRGESFRDIEKATGRLKSTISNDLHAVEMWVGKRFLRSAAGPNAKAAIARLTRVEREQGQRSASIRDWQALRATWVTLALSAGVPMELVRRVTGHATVDVVLRHYFRPGRDEFKAALAGALPSVLTGGKPDAKAVSAADELAGLAAKLAAGSASEADRARFRELAAGV